MTLQKQTIEELKQILEEDYGQEIGFEEATRIAQDFVAWYDTLAKVYHNMKIENSGKAELAATKKEQLPEVDQEALSETADSQ